MIKAEHAGDTCSAFSDVVNFVVGRTQDFAGSAVVEPPRVSWRVFYL